MDDEEDILSTLKGYLEGSIPGLVVHTATSGQAGLAILRKERIEVILSDYKMPEMDGLEFLSEARALAPDVPRILLTAFPDMQLALRALNEARIAHFFTKPMEPEMVRDVVRTTLEARRAAQQRDAALQRSLDLMRRQAKKG